MPSIRLGTASPCTQSTTAETLDLLATLAHRAASQFIDILLLPEAFIGGYPHDKSLGSSIRDNGGPRGREAFAEYFDQAVDLGDTIDGGAGAGDAWVRRELGVRDEQRGDGTREQLEKISSDSGVFIITGLIEKVGGSLYGSVVYVDPSLGMIGKRRKIKPTDIEGLFWAQGAPSTLRAVSTVIRGVRINMAAAICWESYMPLVRQALYAQNINLYLAPNADDGKNWLNCMQSIGFEGRCFVIGSNMCITTSDNDNEDRLNRGWSHFNGSNEEADNVSPLPSSPPVRRRRRKSVMDEDGNEIVLCCPRDNEDAPTINGIPMVQREKNLAAHSWTSRGGSCIIDPFGHVLAGPQWEDQEGLVYADVDFRDCIRGRLDLDVAGSDGRDDSFRFSVEGLNLVPLPY